MTGGPLFAADRQRLLQALSRLPQLSRIVYLLHARDGCGFTEIAFIIGETVQSVEIHLARALEGLVGVLDSPTLQ